LVQPSPLVGWHLSLAKSHSDLDVISCSPRLCKEGLAQGSRCTRTASRQCTTRVRVCGAQHGAHSNKGRAVGLVTRPALPHQRNVFGVRSCDIRGHGWAVIRLQCLRERREELDERQIRPELVPRHRAGRQFPENNPKAVNIHSAAIVLVTSKHFGRLPSWERNARVGK
jgi:hypothetical protein